MAPGNINSTVCTIMSLCIYTCTCMYKCKYIIVIIIIIIIITIIYYYYYFKAQGLKAPITSYARFMQSPDQTIYLLKDSGINK